MVKTFSSVNISSTYVENGVAQKREFVFSLSNHPVDDALTEVESEEYAVCRML